MANYSQSLTGLGKWWGRKPLIIVRAAIFGLLMPASNDPQKDREIFLKILTMDEDGLRRRNVKSLPLKVVYQHLTPREKQVWFSQESTDEKPKLNKGIKKTAKEELQRTVFMRLSYDKKLVYCDRPEQIDGPSVVAWNDINAHLGTDAYNFPELIRQLGENQFGRIPRVGDAFCGGGSVPFEAARLGCEVYSSDLNPIAALLTWSALNIIGGNPELLDGIKVAQNEVYKKVDWQVTEWGIEHNALGWRADAYIYCNETKCPECGWQIPLAPSWVIGEKTNTVSKLHPDIKNKNFIISIESGVNREEVELARNTGTIKDSSLVCPNQDCRKITPIKVIRGDRRIEAKTEYGLRLWENDDLVPRPGDVLKERLYCIRWVETLVNETGKLEIHRHYCAPNESDFVREQIVLNLLKEHFYEWQEKSYIPRSPIEPGDKTGELIRTRGWTYWHHLFNPRQLLQHGLFMEHLSELNNTHETVACLLGLGKCIDRNSKLCVWDSSSANEKVANTFLNQALNPIFNYGCRPCIAIQNTWLFKIQNALINKISIIKTCDARNVDITCDLWVTDPPYADAINYHELSEFFLAWYEKRMKEIFTEWYTDSKRALAITGSDENFRKTMVDCYRNLAQHMPENGAQIVMFTHQNTSVWADLALILWASGLRVTAAWCIVTETDSALKEGNYVQGTVLLVIRKQTSKQTAFLDEIYPLVEIEVKSQLDSMLKLEDKEDPNFGDTDYQLAAYAAALRVLTQYKKIEDIDVMYELTKSRRNGDTNPIKSIIDEAVRIACDYLIPMGFDAFVWKALTAQERFYLRGLDIESRGEYRSGAYQELARGFGVSGYKPMLASVKANQTRLKTASEFSSRQLGDSDFGNSLIRHSLFAVREVVRTEKTETGRNWFRNELKESYWNHRKTLIEILKYLGNLGFTNMAHWKDDAKAAQLLAVAVENDHI